MSSVTDNEFVRLEQHGPVHLLVMVNGENRMAPPWLEAVNAALDEIDRSSDPAALVTTGEGKFYSNGLDLAGLYGKGEAVMRSFVIEAEKLFARLIEAPYVTVAACNGHAFAAGAMLALCHDMRVMRADRGYFCLPEVDLGIPFTDGMDALIRTRLPAPAAHEAMVTGKRYGGHEAAAKGIMHEAVGEVRVLPRAIEIATENAGKDRGNLQTMKQRMYGDLLEKLRTSEGTAPRV